ncbi:MAG TPA: HAD-IA family hydrolase [Firmicutes bacterium]|nr:HAD-IA family hydrolase [Bacillota bacterium]
MVFQDWHKGEDDEMVTQSHPTIIWDFDGTLAHRPGMWSSALLQVLDDNEPGHQVEIAQIRHHLQRGFPWHQPDVPHPELSSPGAWWAAVEAIFAQTYHAVGLSWQRAVELSRLVRERIVDPCGYCLYEDSLGVLEYLADRGWSHIILSNHIPELEQIVSGIGLDHLVTKCLSSAAIGYEKPHPRSFLIALEAARNPARAWMVGDNPIADIAGAESVGIPAILVRRPRTDGIRYHAIDLWEAARIIESRLNE